VVIKVRDHTSAITRKVRKPAALMIMEKRNFLRGMKILTILLGLTVVVNEVNSCTRSGVLLNSWMTKVKSPFSSVPRNFSLDSFLGSDTVLQPDDFRGVTSERLNGIRGKVLTPDLSLTKRATIIADALSKSRGVLHSTAFDSADWLRIYVYEVPTAFTTDLGCNSSFKKSVLEWSSGDGGVIGSWMAMYQLERVSPRKFLDRMQGSSFPFGQATYFSDPGTNQIQHLQA
jgi:hypothetical protein